MDLCVKCRAELPPGALYCPACGKKQVPEKRKALKRANGTGTVYRLQGRRQRPWVAAKNRVVIGYYAKKTDALEALERLSGVDLSERYNMTFAQVFDVWKQEHYQEIGPHGIISILAVLADRDSKDAQKICRVFVQSGEYSLRTKKFSAGRTEKPMSSLPFPVRFPVRTCPGASGRLALALDHQGLFRQVGLLAAKVLDLALVFLSQVVKTQTIPLRIHDRNELCLQCPALGRVQ